MPGKDKRVRYLQRLLDDARKYRKDKYDDIWEETTKWFSGDQKLRSGGDSPGSGNTNDSFRSDWVTNFLFSLIMTEVPLLASSSPQVNLLPITPKFAAHADELNALIPRIYMANDYTIRQTECVTNGLLYGRGYKKPVWDANMMGGLGDIKITVPDTKSIFKDKMWCRDSNWVFEVRQVDKLSLLRTYPQKKAIINKAFLKTSTEEREDSGGTGNTGETTLHASAAGEAAATTSEAYVWDVATNRDRDKASVDVVEAWFVDNSVYEDYMRSQDKGWRPKKKDAKNYRDPKGPAYPHGRQVTFIDGYMDDVLDDRPNPFPMFPYIEFDNYYIPGKKPN